MFKHILYKIFKHPSHI